jgi:hypothetical protein
MQSQAPISIDRRRKETTMVTKTKAPASRKTAASTPAQKKSAPRAPKAGLPARAAGAALDESLRSITQALEGLKLSGAAGTLLEGRRNDLQALVQANKKASAKVCKRW